MTHSQLRVAFATYDKMRGECGSSSPRHCRRGLSQPPRGRLGRGAHAVAVIRFAYLVVMLLWQGTEAHAPAPEEFQIILDTDATGGTGCPIVINVTRSLAPHGADRIFWMAQVIYVCGMHVRELASVSEYVIKLGFIGRCAGSALPRQRVLSRHCARGEEYRM